MSFIVLESNLLLTQPIRAAQFENGKSNSVFIGSYRSFFVIITFSEGQKSLKLRFKSLLKRHWMIKKFAKNVQKFSKMDIDKLTLSEQ